MNEANHFTETAKTWLEAIHSTATPWELGELDDSAEPTRGYLVAQALAHSVDEDGRTPRLTAYDLAELAGVGRETARRARARLRRSGWLTDLDHHPAYGRRHLLAVPTHAIERLQQGGRGANAA